jgi:hypothetical protein
MASRPTHPLTRLAQNELHLHSLPLSKLRANEGFRLQTCRPGGS